MSIETIIVIGFSVLIGLIAFFLQAFYAQVQKVVTNIEEIKIKQAENAEKLNGFERRVQIIEENFFTRNTPQHA